MSLFFDGPTSGTASALMMSARFAWPNWQDGGGWVRDSYARTNRIPPFFAKMPPADGTFRNQKMLQDDGYGPIGFEVLDGFLESTYNNRKQSNPCTHSHIDGCVSCLQTGDEDKIWWRCNESVVFSKLWSLDLQDLYMYKGTPQTLQDKRGYDFNGSLVETGNYDEYAWYNQSRTDACYVSPSHLKTLSPGQRWYSTSDWTVSTLHDEKPTVLNGSTIIRIIRQYIRRIGKWEWEYQYHGSFHGHDNYSGPSIVAPPELGFDHGVGWCCGYIFGRGIISLAGIQSNRKGQFLGSWHFSTIESDCAYRVKNGQYSSWKHNNVLTESEQNFDYTAYLYPFSPGLVSVNGDDVHEVAKRANEYCSRGYNSCLSLIDPDTMTCTRQNAYNATEGLESNWIENLSQVSGTLDVINPLIDAFKALGGNDEVACVKAFASAYLAYCYTIAPNIADVSDVAHNLRYIRQLVTPCEYFQQRRRSISRQRVGGDVSAKGRIINMTYACSLLLQLKDNPLAAIWKKLSDVGLDPDAANLWDLIPFSFVADWFLSIDDALTVMCNYNDCVVTYDLISRTESWRAEWMLNEEERSQIFGNYICESATFVGYKRHVYHDWGKVYPASLLLDKDGMSLSQMLQGSSLITANWR